MAAARVRVGPGVAAGQGDTMLDARRTVLGVMTVALLGLSTALLGAARQPEAAPAPTAEEVFERHIEAIGGREAVFAQKRRRIEGTYQGPGFNGIARLKLWADAPDQMQIHIQEPLGQDMKVSFTGEYGWEHMKGQAPKAVVGPRYVELIDAADFYGESNYKDRYKEIEMLGAGDIAGKRCWVVRAVSHLGRQRQLFFDQDTGLFAAERSTIVRADGAGSFETKIIEVVLTGYKDFGGVLYPTHQEQRIIGDEGLIILDYRSVRMDTSDEFDYLPPAEHRATIEKQWNDLLKAIEEQKKAQDAG